MTLAEARRGADGLMHIIARSGNGRCEFHALGEKTGNGGRKRAARSMRVARVDTRR